MKICFNSINLNDRKYNSTNFSKQNNICPKTKFYNNDTVSFTANHVKEVKAITSNLTPQKIEEFFYLAGIGFKKNTETNLYSIKTFNGLKNRVQEALKIKKINCDDLFQNIEEIRENAIFENTNTTNLGKCKRIKGWAVFERSKVENLGDLEEVGAATFAGNKPSYLGKLKKANYIDAVFAPEQIKQRVKNIQVKYYDIVHNSLYSSGMAEYPAWYKWEINHDKEFAKQKGFSEGVVLF